MSFRFVLEQIARNILPNMEVRVKSIKHYCSFKKWAFKINKKCKDNTQYEAVITRWYHTIEKGLAYENYRPGFGRDSILGMISVMNTYIFEGGNCDADFYKTAIDVLDKYVEKNRRFQHIDEDIESKIKALKGTGNDKGGIFEFVPTTEENLLKLSYEAFVKDRHSMRHFSNEPVAMERIEKALDIAQFTPSACNRQGWNCHVIEGKELIAQVLRYQNGNRGFGEEIDKLLLVTADLRFFNYDRELFQAYVDGGMYAMSVINGLHSQHIATIPLSAALSVKQEKNIRKILNLDSSEVFILFIGAGNYPDHCQTTKSERHAPRMIVHMEK